MRGAARGIYVLMGVKRRAGMEHLLLWGLCLMAVFWLVARSYKLVLRMLH